MRGAALTLLALALVASGCDDMADQAKGKRYRAAAQRAETPPIAGTVAREAAEPPPPLDLALLERGRDRFDIYCTPCHGTVGDGDGMIVERGFPRPPSYHIERLRAAPTRHLYDVITDGYGAMYSYAARIAPRDRWAIAAYVRALQASQIAKPEDVPQDRQAALK
jgi:mono/diheme cytochrome c family protein